MVVIEDGEDAICVGQAAHAWLSGQLARRWGNDRFAAPEPFEEVCLGAEQHDVGMAEWDLRPTLDTRTGRPTHFTAMPRATHLELWSAAPRKALMQCPYAALLVSMHGHALYGRLQEVTDDPGESEAIRRYVAEQEAFQRELLERLGEDPVRARHNQRLVWTLDFLSLALLLGWAPDSVQAPAGRGEPLTEIALEPADERRVTVHPWPFAGDIVRVHTSGRRLPGRHDSEDTMHRALAQAPWVTLRYVLAPR